MCKEERELYILKMFGRSLTHCGKKESGGVGGGIIWPNGGIYL
jgi:hypothetical protein